MPSGRCTFYQGSVEYLRLMMTSLPYTAVVMFLYEMIMTFLCIMQSLGCVHDYQRDRKGKWCEVVLQVSSAHCCVSNFLSCSCIMCIKKKPHTQKNIKSDSWGLFPLTISKFQDNACSFVVIVRMWKVTPCGQCAAVCRMVDMESWVEWETSKVLFL